MKDPISLRQNDFHLDNEHENSTNCDEVLQPSSLAGYTWPENDPSDSIQIERRKNEVDQLLIKSAAVNIPFDWSQFEKNTKKSSVAEKIYFILTSKKFQFNPTGDLRSEIFWLDRIRNFVDNEEPIMLVYPLFCKIGNWAKQHNNIGPAAGEEATIHFFGFLNDIVKNIYKPGIKFNIICDAQLYNSAFQNPEVEVQAYINGSSKLIRDLNAESYIEWHNYVDLLSEYGYAEKYLNLHNFFYQKMMSNPSFLNEKVNVDTLFASVKASINTRKFGLSFQDHREIFSSDVNPQNKYFEAIHQMAKYAFCEVVSIRMACSELNIFEQLFKNHIRVTCHKGSKNGRAVIGLRPYPEYYGSSKLLVYHGSALLSMTKHGLKLDIHPEIILRGRTDLIRVVNENNETYFYDGTTVTQ